MRRLIPALLAGLLSASGLCADGAKKPQYEYDGYLKMALLVPERHEPRGAVPDEQAAVAIALEVWNDAYGSGRIAREAPYAATLHDGFWYVRGSLPQKEGMTTAGGVAHIKIRRADGAVMGYIHTK